MKIYKLIYLLVLLLVLPLGSCRNEEDDSPLTGSYTAVSFQVPSLSVSTATRSTTALAEGTIVTVYAYEVTTDGTNESESTHCTLSKQYITNASGTLVPDDGQPMALLSNLTYKFYAVSPLHSFANGSEKAFDLENSYTGDFKVSSLKEKLTSSTASIAFTAFRLEYAAIRLTLQRDTESTSVLSISPDPAKSGVSFTSLSHSPYLYTLGDPGIDTSASEVDGVLNVPVDAITEITTNDMYTVLGYLLPKKSAPFRITAYLLANGSTESTFSAEIPAMPFLPGKKYTFTVLFTDPKVYLTLRVTDWNGIETSGDLGGDEGIGVTVGDWSTDGWDSGTVGTGDRPNTILVAFWAVSPAAWSTGNLGTGGANSVLHLGDWNGTSWGAGNVGSGDNPNTLTNSGSWTNTAAWSSTDTGKGNGDNTAGNSDWNSGTWNGGNAGTGQPNSITNSGFWSSSTPWNATDTGKGNGDNTIGGSSWKSGSWGTGNAGTDRFNTITGSGSWTSSTPWNTTDTGKGNGNNTLGNSDWTPGNWNGGNVGTGHPNTLISSGSWSATTPWNATDTGKGNGDNTVGGSGWTSGNWDGGNVATDHPNTITGSGSWSSTTPWSSTDTGKGNGDNTLGNSDWNSGSWATGNVATGHPNTITNSGSWSSTTPWNATDIGKNGSNSTVGNSGWSPGSWNWGTTGTGPKNGLDTTTPWNTKTNNMGSMGGQ